MTARPVEKGDFVIFDFTGYLNGEPFAGGAAKDFQLEIGSGGFIPGFEDQIIGMTAGEEKRITVTFPEPYANNELAGKETEFDIAVKEIKVKEIPELDDEFAQAVGGFETLGATAGRDHRVGQGGRACPDRW